MSKSIRSNYIYNVVYQILLIILPIATTPYLSRVLGPEQLGIYSYTYSIAYYFVLFAMLGVGNYGNRSIAEVRDDEEKVSKRFWSIYYLQLLCTLIITVLYLAYSILFAGNTAIALIWLAYIISAGLDINWFFFGLEEFKITVIRNLAIKLSVFVLIFILVKGQNALAIYCILMSSSFFLAALALWPFLRSRVTFCSPCLRQIIPHVKPNLVLFAPVIAITAYELLDKIILGLVSSMAQVGFFENALKVNQISFALIAALGTVMLPRATNLLAQQKNEEVQRLIGVSMWFALFLAVGLAGGLSGIAEVFAPIFFGEEFRECGVLICILMMGMPFKAWANILRTQYLIPAKKDRAYVVSVFIGAIVSVVLNILLAPTLGAFGAAIALTICQIFVCVSQSCFARNDLPQTEWLKGCVPFLAIGLIMFVTVRLTGYVLGESVFTLCLQIFIGAFVYLCLVYLWCTFTKNSNFETLVKPIAGKFRRF